MSELWGVACHMGSHIITCHPTQVNTPRLNPSQWRLVLDLPTPEGWKARLRNYLRMLNCWCNSNRGFYQI